MCDQSTSKRVSEGPHAFVTLPHRNSPATQVLTIKKRSAVDPQSVHEIRVRRFETYLRSKLLVFDPAFTSNLSSEFLLYFAGTGSLFFSAFAYDAGPPKA